MMAKEPIGFKTGSRSKELPLDPLKEFRKIQRKLLAIIKALDQLNSRVEELGLMGFQEQLTAFDTKVRRFEEQLLRSQRHVASMDVYLIAAHIKLRLRMEPVEQSTQEKRVNARSQADRQEAAAIATIQGSSDPLSIAVEFRKLMVEYLAKAGFEYFQPLTVRAGQ